MKNQQTKKKSHISKNDDVLGIRSGTKAKIVRKIKIGAITTAVIVSPLALFGCATKM